MGKCRKSERHNISCGAYDIQEEDWTNVVEYWTRLQIADTRVSQSHDSVHRDVVEGSIHGRDRGEVLLKALNARNVHFWTRSDEILCKRP